MGFPKEGPLKYKQNIGYHCHSLNQVQSHNSIPAPIVKHNSRPFLQEFKNRLSVHQQYTFQQLPSNFNPLDNTFIGSIVYIMPYHFHTVKKSLNCLFKDFFSVLKCKASDEFKAGVGTLTKTAQTRLSRHRLSHKTCSHISTLNVKTHFTQSSENTPANQVRQNYTVRQSATRNEQRNNKLNKKCAN